MTVKDPWQSMFADIVKSTMNNEIVLTLRMPQYVRVRSYPAIENWLHEILREHKKNKTRADQTINHPGGLVILNIKGKGKKGVDSRKISDAETVYVVAAVSCALGTISTSASLR